MNELRIAGKLVNTQELLNALFNDGCRPSLQWLRSQTKDRTVRPIKIGDLHARVEKSLYHRATGYTCDDCHVSRYEGRITVAPLKKHYPPDVTACIFWLKNRKPQEWPDRSELHVEQEIAGVPQEVVEALRKRFVETFRRTSNGNGH
jgi:hypothetical protein